MNLFINFYIMRNFLIGLLLVLIPAITNAEFICKSIGPDSKYPQYSTFYRCRNITNVNEESNDIKSFFNL